MRRGAKLPGDRELVLDFVPATAIEAGRFPNFEREVRGPIARRAPDRIAPASAEWPRVNRLGNLTTAFRSAKK